MHKMKRNPFVPCLHIHQMNIVIKLIGMAVSAAGWVALGNAGLSSEVPQDFRGGLSASARGNAEGGLEKRPERVQESMEDDFVKVESSAGCIVVNVYQKSEFAEEAAPVVRWTTGSGAPLHSPDELRKYIRDAAEGFKRREGIEPRLYLRGGRKAISGDFRELVRAAAECGVTKVIFPVSSVGMEAGVPEPPRRKAPAEDASGKEGGKRPCDASKRGEGNLSCADD